MLGGAARLPRDRPDPRAAVTDYRSLVALSWQRGTAVYFGACDTAAGPALRYSARKLSRVTLRSSSCSLRSCWIAFASKSAVKVAGRSGRDAGNLTSFVRFVPKPKRPRMCNKPAAGPKPVKAITLFAEGL